MAYHIIRTNGAFNPELSHVETEITAILDAAADLDSLGTTWEPGSIAIVADAGMPKYMLNASKVWKEV